MKKGILKEKYYQFHCALYSRRVKRDNSVILSKVKDNSKLRGIHKGESVFICGNGPSMNTVDYALLKGKNVITVNWSPLSDKFKELDSKYHILMDPAFFQMRDDLVFDDNKLHNLYEKLCNSDMELFVLGSGYDFISKCCNALDKFHYLMVGESYLVYKPKRFDLCECIPTFTNVVQYAIVVALYLGFEDIYLLGCDQTAVEGYINEILGRDGKVSYMAGLQNQNNFVQKLEAEKVMYDQYILFEGFKYLKEYCEENRVSIYNCSKPSLVTAIPYKDYLSVL